MTETKLIATNRKARHDYQILETFEAGLALKGTEVKSLRQGRANINDSYGMVAGGEAFLCNAHVSPYEFGNRENPDPLRKRKLLLHKREIAYLEGQTAQKGLACIPLKLYFKEGRAKVELALAKGKKAHDKRETIKRRVAEREIERAMKGRVR
ncbi:MAG: SsrA-binding protein SmpB [Candidatus Aureabacteria bacterium]|nr:SsrA-binding protein SmpB [Candidatus Auribacterota bacterium]